MLATYTSTPVGGYDELIVSQPFTVKDETVMRVTRIYVSTMDTLVNGRENWDVAKVWVKVSLLLQRCKYMYFDTFL